MDLAQSIADDLAKLAEYQSDIRHHELRIASIRRAQAIVEARLARMRKKAAHP